MSWGSQPLRLLAAALVVLVYLALCGAIVWRERRRQRRDALAAAALMPAAPGHPLWLIGFASQTGFAEEIAWQTARALHAAGVAARIVPLAELSAELLGRTERALFITSTYGEGDPPDAATLFARKVMTATPVLTQLHFAVLALGDREYDHFCGFGRTLDNWLARCGAQPLFERVEVDNGDTEALQRWQRQLGHAAGIDDLPAWQAPQFDRWRLAARRHLNPGSAGAPTFHLELVPSHGAPLPTWQSGDLVQIAVPAEPDRPREYSIASLPADGSLQLLVRQERHRDGTLGVASGWLTDVAAPGAEVLLRLRAHRNFQLGANATRPLILVGNGTGLAGLRGHLKARAAAGQTRNWLVFGERNAAHDFYHRDEIEAWQRDGVLARADLVFSRDQPERLHVQHRLRDAADDLRRWIVDDGAAVYVCGSLEGMAGGVDAALAHILGSAELARLAEAGRYRRDVY